MPTVHLSERALIDVDGPGAEGFLQNVLTNDFGCLAQNEARPGALLSPQGKILFDYLVSRKPGGGFVFECRSDVADDFGKRLTLYRLRAKAEISRREEVAVGVSWGTQAASGEIASTGLLDRRFPDTRRVVRHYGASSAAADAPMDDWHLLRIDCAVPESGLDFALGDAFPHEILFDQNGGVGLRKGCFVGQEVVSRMHHRGTARRRLMIVESRTALPAPGTTLSASGRPLGTLGTVVGNTGLAIARIDRVKEAMDADTPILAGDAAVDLAIPAWTDIRFPEGAPNEEGVR